jgi:hypothetical protein
MQLQAASYAINLEGLTAVVPPTCGAAPVASC